MIDTAIPQPGCDGSLPPCKVAPRTTSFIDNLKLARFVTLLMLAVFPLTLGLAITRQSLWTDEGSTFWFASHKDAASFFSALVGSPGAPGDPQIIFYLLYIWTWTKFFGASELMLRAANIPFAILFIGAMGWGVRRLLGEPKLWILFCLSPFFWFYLNEARPYIALMAFSSLSSVALLAYLIYPVEYKTSAPWVCCVALLFACSTHIMSVFLFPCLVVLTVATAWDEPHVRRNLLKDWYSPALLCLPMFLALGFFYIRASANGVNRFGKPVLSSLVYVLYEFAGFQGLGPPRNEIRGNPNFSVFAPYWPLLLIGVAALAGMFIVLSRAHTPRIVRFLIVGLAAGAAVALTISRVADFQLLGRHMAALFPLFLLTPLVWWKSSLAASSRSAKCCAIAVLGFVGITWAISDVRLVLLSKYGKDSYRDACSIASQLAERDRGTILWAADPYTAFYYGMQIGNFGRPEGTGRRDRPEFSFSPPALDARNWTICKATAYLNASTTPTILVLSKTDAFDDKGGWQTLVRERKPTEMAHLTAFTIFEWQPSGLTAITTACHARTIVLQEIIGSATRLSTLR